MLKIVLKYQSYLESLSQMVVHGCNPNTEDAEARGLYAQGQSGY